MCRYYIRVSETYLDVAAVVEDGVAVLVVDVVQVKFELLVPEQQLVSRLVQLWYANTDLLPT